MGDNLFAGFIMPFMGVLFIIFLAYWGTRWLSKKYNRICTGRYIKILERIALGQDKSLILVEMSDKVYLLGVSPKGVDTISILEPGQVQELPPISPSQGEFPDIFKDILKKQSFFGKAIKGWGKDNDSHGDGGSQ